MTTPSAPEIYCVECKAHTESRDAQVVTMKNGRRATRCPGPSALRRDLGLL